MRHDTHVSLSLNGLFTITILTAETIGVYFKSELFIPILIGVVFGSLLPDIDEPESFIGRKFLFVSEILKSVYGHRGASHYLIVPVLIFTIALFLNGLSSLFLFGLSFGYLLHITGDLMTLGGINGLLFPFGSKTKRYVLLPKRFRFRTNSPTENVIAMFLGVVFFYQIYLIYEKGVIR